MKLKDYLSGYEKIVNLARSVKKSASFIWQIADGRRSCSPALCVLIEQATNGVVTRKDLRPNDWEAIWPELKEDAHGCSTGMEVV